MTRDEALTILQAKAAHAVFVVVNGSQAHGTALKDSSDFDLLGAAVPPLDYYLGTKKYGNDGTKEVREGDLDAVVYEARKLCRLLAGQNPNTLMMLFTRREDVLLTSTAGEFLRENRSLFVTANVATTFMGYATSAIKKMGATDGPTGDMGAKRKAYVEEFGYDCYDDETTEFLTSSGWRRFDDVTEEMRLAAVDPKTGELKWEKPVSRTDRMHTGEMYVVEPHLTKCIVTPNHNMLVSPWHVSDDYSTFDESRADWRLTPMSELVAGHRRRFHVRRWPARREQDLSGVDDDYLMLAGLFLSDGSVNFRDDKVKSVNLSQVKQGKFAQLADGLMKRLPLRRSGPDARGQVTWTIHGGAARQLYADFGHSKDKHLPMWAMSLSARQMTLLWRAMMTGDGTVHKENGDVIYTSYEGLADSVQAAMTSAGLACVKNGPYRAETNFGVQWMYHLYHPNHDRDCHILQAEKHPPLAGEVIGKDGHPVKRMVVDARRVVCFEVPTGVLVTRNDGKVAVQGNCKDACHLVRLLRMGEEILLTGQVNVWRGDLDADELKAIKVGEWPLERVKAEADAGFARVRAAELVTTLPKEVDHDKVSDICMEMVRLALL